jgi:D-glycero-D-manno-heptose 1,7-bisphosphate phosphatase
MEPAIFLDRDGTLVLDDEHAGNPAQVRIIDGVSAALRRLRDAGFRLVVATNQGGVARGRFTEADVDAVHARVGELIDASTGLKRTIDRFYYCPFHPKGTVASYAREHPWRKPKPGMLLQAAQDMELDLEASWLVGDSPRDIAAGRAAGLRTILVSRDHARIAEAAADFTVASLGEAVEVILRNRDASTQTRLAQQPRATKRAAQRASKRGKDNSSSLSNNLTTATAAGQGLATSAASGAGASSLASRKNERLRRALSELTEEVRALRLRRSETGAIRIAAMGVQLLAILVAAVAFLNLAEFENFVRWGLGAALLQLVTATILLFDRH